jgi:hypothetical protein
MGGKGFVIHMETRFANYCPFDSMYVNFENNLLSDSVGYGGDVDKTLQKLGYKNLHWMNTYHAHCPKDLVNKRIKEERGEVEPDPVPEPPPPPEPPRPYLEGEKVIYVKQGERQNKTAVFVSIRDDGKYRIRWDDTGNFFACNPKNIRHAEEKK